MVKLAIVVSHPTQYYSPWFQMLAADSSLELRVFYLWDFGVTIQRDPVFKQVVKWDIPLLEGYEYEFVPNVSRNPGTHHFNGLNNPDLGVRIRQFEPDAVLLFGHGWRTMVDFLLFRKPQKAPILFRGDSHLLGRTRRGARDWVKHKLASYLFRRCNAFLAVGRANADYFRAHGVDNSKIHLVPHCVDNERFQGAERQPHLLRKKLGISPNQRVVLFAGKFENKKRPLDLLNAFVNANVENAVLIFAGAGVLETPLRQRAGRDPRILFLPFQNQSGMPELYSMADLFVLPSCGGGETWGLAVNEAMNCGCGIILSDHVGCAADLVIQHENGLVVNAGDVYALARAIKDALEDDERLKLWKRRGQEIISKYSYAVAKESLLRALANVISSVGQVKQESKAGS